MNRTLTKAALLSTLLSVLWAGSASANLIVNGGFEATPDGDPKKIWSSTQKGYTSSQIKGWSGDDMELWCGHSSPSAIEGNCYAELNAHFDDTQAGSDSTWDFYQTFDTVLGQVYDISFVYNARSGVEEVFKFTVDDLSVILSDHSAGGDWLTYSGQFTADNDSATLMFTSVFTTRYTYGNFIDDVVVTAVPEPSILALMGLGLLGIRVARRRKI